MTLFEKKLKEAYPALERYCRYRLPGGADAEDVIQEVCLSAFRNFSQLNNPDGFLPWIVGIARNKCNDWYRRNSGRQTVSLEDELCAQEVCNRFGRTRQFEVRDALERMGQTDRQMLTLFYLEELPQKQIARQMQIPLGTVKSRLHTAKQRFRQMYPEFSEIKKGEHITMKLPDFLPEYTIEESPLPPFSCICEELPGWQIVPKMGEKLTWALYDQPSRRRTEYAELQVVGKAVIHGVEGVEFTAVQHDTENYYRTGAIREIERRFVAQLTDTHCRFLAETHVENGVRRCFTFLDGDAFLNNWGYGEDNCGIETHLRRKGVLNRQGNCITARQMGKTDVVGRYTVTIGEKSYDTICLMDAECFDDTVASEQYIDSTGRTVLWRRFNRDDWAQDRFGKPWSDLLPHNERLTINGERYVHWYDCVTDRIL